MEFPLLLRQALPYLQNFSGKTFVVKTGGQVLAHPDFEQLIFDVACLSHLKIRVVFVFGAGPQFDEKLENEKISFQKIDGLRITTAEMLPILQKIIDQDFTKISKLFAKEKVATAAIEKFLRAEKVEFSNYENPHCTGTIAQIETAKISELLQKEIVPICFSIVDGKNCNADDVAVGLAKFLRAEKLIFLTGTKGIFQKNGELLSAATPEKLQKLIENKTIKLGMIPKARAAIDAIGAGIPRVHILSGLQDGTLLTEVFTRRGCGTMIFKNEK
jgi:acetylglutamate kinase